MVIDETAKACILFEYRSIENFICVYLKENKFTKDVLDIIYLKRKIHLIDEDTDETDDQKDEILEYMACVLTKKLFENNQEMIPYLVRALYKKL